MKPTPTDAGLRQYDDMPIGEAIQRAWNDEGEHPEYHAAMRMVVRDAMPVLARALDRTYDGWGVKR